MGKLITVNKNIEKILYCLTPNTHFTSEQFFAHKDSYVYIYYLVVSLAFLEEERSTESTFSISLKDKFQDLQ